MAAQDPVGEAVADRGIGDALQRPCMVRIALIHMQVEIKPVPDRGRKQLVEGGIGARIGSVAGEVTPPSWPS